MLALLVGLVSLLHAATSAPTYSYSYGPGPSSLSCTPGILPPSTTYIGIAALKFTCDPQPASVGDTTIYYTTDGTPPVPSASSDTTSTTAAGSSKVHTTPGLTTFNLLAVTTEAGVSSQSAVVAIDVIVYGLIEDAITITFHDTATLSPSSYHLPQTLGSSACDAEFCTSLTSYPVTSADPAFLTFTCPPSLYDIVYTITTTANPSTPLQTSHIPCNTPIPYHTLLPTVLSSEQRPYDRTLLAVTYHASTAFVNSTQAAARVGGPFGIYLIDTEEARVTFRIVWPRLETSGPVGDASGGSAAGGGYEVTPFRRKLSDTRSLFGHVVTLQHAHVNQLHLLPPQPFPTGCDVDGLEGLRTPRDNSVGSGAAYLDFLDGLRESVVVSKEQYDGGGEEMSAAMRHADDDFDDYVSTRMGTHIDAEVGREKGFCGVAVNAGMFDTALGKCLGNSVLFDVGTGGRQVFKEGGGAAGDQDQTSDQTSNVGFAITQTGAIHTGYFKQSEVTAANYNLLVTGCIWIVRNGVPYTQVSLKEDDMSIQTTGDQFVTVQSARTVIGVTEEGAVKIVMVDGKTWSYGATLAEMGELCIEYGLVNCINLDGGGSASMTYKGVLVNTPSYSCVGEEEGGEEFAKSDRCAKPVGNVLCVSEGGIELDKLPPRVVCGDCGEGETMAPTAAPQEGQDGQGGVSEFTLFLVVLLAVSLYFNCRKLVLFNESKKYKDITPRGGAVEMVGGAAVTSPGRAFAGDFDEEGEGEEGEGDDYFARNAMFSNSYEEDEDEESNPFSPSNYR